MRDDLEVYLVPADCLADFSARVFMHFGIPEAPARQAADVLARSDLRGIDSHGVARLHTYFDMLALGRINPKPNIKIVREKASVTAVDGDNG
jgi:LDH2 family malate/lactate/ureidoglycolate dehydrogenase